MYGTRQDANGTDVFRYGGQGAFLIAALSAMLAILLVAAARIGPGADITARQLVQVVLGVVFLATLGGVPLWLRRRAPVLLRIGPDGFELPATWSKPLPWDRIRRIRAERRGGPLTWRIVLILDLAEGVLPPYRLATARRLELWFLRRVGLRIPISSLDRDADTVIASIRRFRPVARQAR